MTTPGDFSQAFEQARQLQAQGRLAEAEQAFKQLAAPGEHRETVLRALVEFYRQGGRLQETIGTLVSLTEVVPDRLYYYARLAAVLEGCGQVDQAINHYLRLLQRQPGLAEAHYNLALLHKKNRSYSEAMASYHDAVKFGISNVEEVYSNMGVLYSELRQPELAKDMYKLALEARSGYTPALFNLAGLLEESGDRQQAIALYQRILALDPQHWEALARLAHARRLTDADRPLVDTLRRSLDAAGGDRAAKEGLHFALGKALDDLGQYADAFAAYRVANELSSQRIPPYDRRGAEEAFSQLIGTFSRDWLQSAATGFTARPIFICGMFRSGSTLVEQILASHPRVKAGGELDWLPWLVGTRLMPFPQRVVSIPRGELEEIGDRYLSQLKDLFPDADHITDKRPDNFMLLGLIKTLFPSARIIYTRRHPVDNCLSVYFQQLGDNLGYATDLENIAHYYMQHVRLVTHWLDCFPENIFTLDYDELVGNPEPILRKLLEFLELEWDERCLAFQESGGQVKTASVWQVREALYTRSSGRWKNYAPFLPGTFADLEAVGA